MIPHWPQLVEMIELAIREKAPSMQLRLSRSGELAALVKERVDAVTVARCARNCRIYGVIPAFA